MLQTSYLLLDKTNDMGNLGVLLFNNNQYTITCLSQIGTTS